MRVLSGIQPTGRFHWGNFFGAIRQYIDLQHDNEGYYFIADLHALTTVRDPNTLRQNVVDAATDLLALGLDPNKATLYVQSDVPEISELFWLLITSTPMGLLERCVAYKEKIERGIPTNAGLFSYPVLQAADILAVDANLVPVGEDQVQHIEVCRDIAGSFNHTFGETFVIPDARILESGARVPGTDGQKMSKSYNNTIPIFGDLKHIRKKLIMKIETDNREMDDPKDPDTCNLMDLLRLVGDAAEVTEMEGTYRRGGFGYGHVKKMIADASEEFFGAARQRRTELEANVDYVHQVLRDGAERARARAASVLARAQHNSGIRGKVDDKPMAPPATKKPQDSEAS